MEKQMRIIEKMLGFKTKNLFVGDAFLFKADKNKLVDMRVKDVVQMDKNGQYVSVVSKKIYLLNLKHDVCENKIDIIANLEPYAKVTSTASKRTSKKEVLDFYNTKNKQFDKNEILVLDAEYRFWEVSILACLKETGSNRKSYYMWSSGRILDRELCYENENNELVFPDGKVKPLLYKHRLVNAYPEMMKKYKHRFLTQKEMNEIAEFVVSKTMTEERLY